MKLRQRRREVQAAQQRLARARDGLHASAAALRERVDRHGPGANVGAIVGAGVATGALVARVPARRLLRAARFALDASLLLMRLPAGLWLAAARSPTAPATPERGA